MIMITAVCTSFTDNFEPSNKTSASSIQMKIEAVTNDDKDPDLNIPVGAFVSFNANLKGMDVQAGRKYALTLEVLPEETPPDEGEVLTAGPANS